MLSSEFSPIQIKELQASVIKLFGNFFESKKYKLHPPIGIISEYDHSVRLTGSTSNTFKVYISEKKALPKSGFFLIQPCLRSQNADSLADDKKFPEWGSYFTEIGVIADCKNLLKISKDTVDYLTNFIGIERDRLVLKVSSVDSDLISCCNSLHLEVEVDGQTINHYRHKYGLQETFGRNFNIAIKDSTGTPKDIGNIIVIERNDKAIAVEMGLGVSTLLARKYSLRNSIESSTISMVVPFDVGNISKFSDALSTVLVMLNAGLCPGGRDKNRILRSYLHGLDYLRKKCRLSIDDVLRYSVMYEDIEFGCVNFLMDPFVEYFELESE